MYSKRVEVLESNSESSTTAASTNELPLSQGYDSDGSAFSGDDSSSTDEHSEQLSNSAEQISDEDGTSAIDDLPLDDVGALLKMMPLSSIRSLPPEKKYLILIQYFRPGSSFKFPSRYLDGCNRSCQYKYLQENPWFVYRVRYQ